MLRNLTVNGIIVRLSLYSTLYTERKSDVKDLRYKQISLYEAMGPSYLKEMAKELGSALFLTRKAPSRGTLISIFSAWLLERLAWYHLG